MAMRAARINTPAPPGAVAHPSGPRLDRERFEWGSLILLLPCLVLLGGLFIVPVAYAFYLGFTNLSLIGPTAINYQFTGSANLSKLLGDADFSQSVVLTFIFVFGSGVIGVTVVGMLLAVLMQHAVVPLRLLAGAVAIVAWMLPPVTAATLWYAFTTSGGTIAVLIHDPNADYLHTYPMLVICLANVWATTGFAVIVFSAALRNVPDEVTEAAKVEGAGSLVRFGWITLPLMWPTIVTTVLLVSLLTLANFSLVYIMTQGGPNNQTNILPVYSYLQAFNFDNLAYGALVGDAMVVMATVLAFIYVRVSRVQV